MPARPPLPERPPTSPSNIDGLLARWLPEKYILVSRFGFAGLTATVVYFVLSNGLVMFASLQPPTASVAAYALTLCLSFVLQSRFAFRTTDHFRQRSARFLAMSAAGLLVAFGVMEIATQHLGWPALAGSLAVCILIPVMNYIAMRTWVFRPLAGRATCNTIDTEVSRGCSRDD